ncbi:starch phosphorylase [Natronobacillus azotifigens]|uniref:glycogen phosphorylase n=1 Tax=Natronobacillus azotifigens TaxID=472978 RepID=A0A9J6R923_9BACI|nr:alpha-glucan family phosphorylase [Natronobacillus azotifigens]MCZ0702047.1 alpha-glucan family phosphorylase [Natronobacillus azotifigens]
MAKKYPNVAYFCMEYGLDATMKTYAGGLGILAGDYLKGAKDHEFPLVGIGIKWKQGYTDQRIDENGNPYDAYHNYDYDYLEDTGVKVTVKIRQRDVVCKVWKIEKFGNVPLYLLDTDIPENEDAWITGQLYGWFGEERIAQEMVLGIGGVRALRALGLDIDVYHFNEGHALFAGFELMKEEFDQGATFEEALNATRAKTVFTTHTPIIQGNESHHLDRLMYMGANNGLTLEQLVEIGGAPFNMTVGALRMSRKSNAVAELHGETANKMWAHVEGRSEIIPITNCIHKPTWVDENMIKVAEDGGDLWEAHMKNKRDLISFIHERNGVTLKENKLIIGFSRRAAPYKRSDFIFTDESIIGPLLESGKVQIVFSGKAHPLDDTGKGIVSSLVKMSKKYPEAVVFLENYDMTIGAALTRGSDLWLNNPRRPKEASGTSGMKAAMNGVLNFSTLDGWWPEACNHGVNGWQFGDGMEFEDEAVLDTHDLKALYDVLQNEVLPTYYDKHEKWVEMMRESILSTKEQFAVKRMLENYYEKLYAIE